MKISKVFRLAKKHLSTTHSDTKFKYICHSIEYSIPFGNLSAVGARNVIEDRLGQDENGYLTVENWLVNRGLIPENTYEIDYGYYFDLVQAYRHRWLDSLILEFEAKGQ
jgi:hypothetical protein